MADFELSTEANCDVRSSPGRLAFTLTPARVTMALTISPD
jgi:hypothetical protein